MLLMRRQRCVNALWSAERLVSLPFDALGAPLLHSCVHYRASTVCRTVPLKWFTRSTGRCPRNLAARCLGWRPRPPAAGFTMHSPPRHCAAVPFEKSQKLILRKHARGVDAIFRINCITRSFRESCAEVAAGPVDQRLKASCLLPPHACPLTESRHGQQHEAAHLVV
jgi:hypothetical protein